MEKVRMKVVVEANEQEIEEDFSIIIEFEDFHDAWEWIYKEHGNYIKLSNPTMNLEINEIPTEERAERLYRYACNILGGENGKE